MAVLTNNFDGPDGTTITVGNSATYGDAFASPINLNSGDIEYDTAQFMHGTASALVQPASGAVSELRWDYSATTTAVVSFYVRLSGSFSTASTLCQVRNSSGSAAILQINTSTLRFRVQNSAGTSLFNSATISTGTWYRVEMRVVRGTSTTDGTIQFAYYLGDSLTPVETAYSSTAVNAGTTDLTNVRIGRPSSATADVTTFWIDSAQLLSGSDAGSLGNPWSLQPIELTTTRVSDTAVDVAWTHPSDATAGVSIIRCLGTQENDGNGNVPEDAAYDPTTLAGSTTVANSLDGGDTPYHDTGLTAQQTWTYWVVRTSP